MVWRLGIALSSLFLFLSLFAEATDHGKIKFKKGTLKISGKKISVDIAGTEELRSRGLMYRKSMPDNHGMLFIFPNEATRSFWMKNTWIPLDIGFFDKDQKLVEVLQMDPPKSVMVPDQSLPRYNSRFKARFALEMNQGWFKRQNIKPGSTFQILTSAGQ